MSLPQYIFPQRLRRPFESLLLQSLEWVPSLYNSRLTTAYSKLAASAVSKAKRRLGLVLHTRTLTTWNIACLSDTNWQYLLRSWYCCQNFTSQGSQRTFLSRVRFITCQRGVYQWQDEIGKWYDLVQCCNALPNGRQRVWILIVWFMVFLACKRQSTWFWITLRGKGDRDLWLSNNEWQCNDSRLLCVIVICVVQQNMGDMHQCLVFFKANAKANTRFKGVVVTTSLQRSVPWTIVRLCVAFNFVFCLNVSWNCFFDCLIVLSCAMDDAIAPCFCFVSDSNKDRWIVCLHNKLAHASCTGTCVIVAVVQPCNDSSEPHSTVSSLPSVLLLQTIAKHNWINAKQHLQQLAGCAQDSVVKICYCTL